MNIRAKSSLFFACLSLFSFGCGPKKPKAEDAQPSSGQVFISFSFDSRDGNSGSAAYAIVNPWELKPGEMWQCGATSKIDDPYTFIAVIWRKGPNSFTYGAGQGTTSQTESLCKGSLCIAESNAVESILLVPSNRSVRIEIISKQKADELKKQAKDSGGEFVECEKEGEVSVQKDAGHHPEIPQ